MTSEYTTVYHKAREWSAGESILEVRLPADVEAEHAHSIAQMVAQDNSRVRIVRVSILITVDEEVK